MAFDWNQYPDAGGMTGANIYLDPSQIQVANGGINGTGPNPLLSPSSYSPTNPYFNYTGPNADVGLATAQDSRTISNPSPTSPMQGGGGITGGLSIPPAIATTAQGQMYNPATNVPRDPSTGQPLNVQPGSGQPVDPSQWQQFTADLGIASDTNHTGINTLSQRLQQAGYQVQPGPIDSMGRQDSLVINGVLTRVFDSNGNWKPVQDVNGSAWNSGSGGGGVNGSAGNVLGSLGYSFGSAMAPFTPPTADQALQSPGLQFALDEANRMMQNGAAARGTLLNGRFQQALNASNIQNALQGYNDVYNRAYQTFTRNQDAPFSKQLSLAQLGKPT